MTNYTLKNVNAKANVSLYVNVFKGAAMIKKHYNGATIALFKVFMTGYELRLWRKGMGWDQERAAEELGKCLRTYKAYEKSQAIDRIVELATGR